MERADPNGRNGFFSKRSSYADWNGRSWQDGRQHGAPGCVREIIHVTQATSSGDESAPRSNEFIRYYVAIFEGEYMRIGIATDHGGFWLKEDLLARLTAAGHEAVDFGADRLDSGDDYPDFVIPLARAVAVGKVERGIAVCGSGVGASVCANKIPGVRAGLISDHFSARQGVEDDHMNIICLGARTLGPFLAWDLVEAFLAAEFSQAERHLRRLAKVASLETNVNNERSRP